MRLQHLTGLTFSVLAGVTNPRPDGGANHFDNDEVHFNDQTLVISFLICVLVAAETD